MEEKCRPIIIYRISKREKGERCDGGKKGSGTEEANGPSSPSSSVDGGGGDAEITFPLRPLKTHICMHFTFREKWGKGERMRRRVGIWSREFGDERKGREVKRKGEEG